MLNQKSKTGAVIVGPEICTPNSSGATLATDNGLLPAPDESEVDQTLLVNYVGCR